MKPVVALSLLLTGCATTLPSGDMVREVRGTDTQGCQFLGVVKGQDVLSTSSAIALGKAQDQARSLAAARGANAIVILDSHASMSDQYTLNGRVMPGAGQAYVTGEAYRCPESAPLRAGPI